jgi:hypothetical protein
MPFDATDRYEVRARVFRNMTGEWPPGKDVPAAVGGYDAEASRLAWAEWEDKFGRCVTEVFSAIEEIGIY